MKILLVHPPCRLDKEHYRIESLGLGYIGAVLRRDGHEVEVLDAHLRFLDLKATIRETLKRDFDCLGITAMHEQGEFLIGLAKGVRKQRKNATLFAGGYLPTLAPEQLLKLCPEIDFLVRGEGEVIVCDVMGRLQRGENWRETPGVAYLENEQLVMNPLPPLIEDLDTLPFPIRDALMDRHPDAVVEAVVQSSRGCYHRCSFCCANYFYSLSGTHTPRYRSPKNFVDEIESVVEATGISRFAFVDDDFIGPGDKYQQRTVDIADEIISRNLKVTFNMECRCDEVNEKVLLRLKEAGLSSLFLGVESGVQRQLDTYNKRVSVDTNKAAIEAVRRTGINMDAGFIMFDPYITVDEIQENMRFIKDTGLYGGSFAISKVRLYQGVPLAERVREDGLLKESGLELDFEFKDPQTKLAWKIAKASDSFNKFMRRAKWMMGRGKTDRAVAEEKESPEPVGTSVP